MRTIRRNQITLTFLGFLALATISGGVTYQTALALFGGHGSGLNALVFLVSVPLFGFAMLVLGRILYLTSSRAKQVRTEN